MRWYENYLQCYALVSRSVHRGTAATSTTEELSLSVQNWALGRRMAICPRRPSLKFRVQWRSTCYALRFSPFPHQPAWLYTGSAPNQTIFANQYKIINDKITPMETMITYELKTMNWIITHLGRNPMNIGNMSRWMEWRMIRSRRIVKMESNKTLSLYIYHQCFAQGQVLHCKLRHQGCNSAQRQVFHCNLRNLGGSFGRVASRCFPHR